MSRTNFNALKSYVGFSEQDAENLRTLRPQAECLIPGVVESFYKVIMSDNGASKVLAGDEALLARLKGSLSRWCAELFCGNYDNAYYMSQYQVGRAHVEVKLPQQYMPLAMEVVRIELRDRLLATCGESVRPQIASLEKLLTLDLTIMLDSYKESHSEMVRELERRALEGKLARSQHLAEVGQLAASLAHEIKNPLAGISGAIQVIGESLPADNPHREIVPEILAQISRLDATVKDLLLYARPSPPSLKQIRIGQLADRTIALLHEEPALKSIQVTYTGADQTVEADERQLEQLLVNLLLNAADASTNSSPIEIDSVDVGQSFRIIVRDHGCGMLVEVRRRATEPFYTTKSRGTGLGLAICRRIAESHGGSLAIESAPGKGTTVTVELPRYPSQLLGDEPE